MLTAKNLERVMELESKLRDEYESQLAEKNTQIETAIAERDANQTAIEKQLEQISELSTAATANKRVEQLNRELNQRCDNLQEELSAQKKRTKTLQKDLAQERAEVAELKKFDPPKMKKNLDANKKKLAEKTSANELLQKSLNKAKAEQAELQRKVKELEAKLEELEPTEDEAVEDAA
ncbi:MAG: hypothetical protein AB8C02_09070 [Halioglobus sp.]